MQDHLITLDNSGSLRISKGEVGDLGSAHGSPGSIIHAGLESKESCRERELHGDGLYRWHRSLSFFRNRSAKDTSFMLCIYIVCVCPCVCMRACVCVCVCLGDISETWFGKTEG